MMQLEGLQKNSMTSSGLVAQCLNHPCYRMPPLRVHNTKKITNMLTLICFNNVMCFISVYFYQESDTMAFLNSPWSLCKSIMWWLFNIEVLWEVWGCLWTEVNAWLQIWKELGWVRLQFLSMEVNSCQKQFLKSASVE
jgi:hypothetical protein